MFKKHQICEILSVSEGTIAKLPNFPEKIDSQYLSNLVLYRKDDVFTWLYNVINTREGCKHYQGEIEKERVIRLSELTVILNVSKSHIYAQVEKGHLPQPIKMGKRASGWLLSEVNEVLLQSGLDEIV
ncbi:helix-turn-helix transcriptional regulator [Vibrio alginolyticus]|uniref:helix-turn-helix transcriptional regulator n=1 Tax=Vibrio alginolyticus TaxID=663 RepID=UPI0006A78C40|nr:AlpA family phage regulatory protein [Vibrio alginolyticus]MCG6322847.1 AlpA family phage regulatory protein [Vibrio alginolyticus]MCR9520686.1 AlpA family phage regulatory protein [Vibrio alginolyticus]MCS0168062.1 AlpA family phage regulatory protein [Vibrio alginolyticus]MCS0290377.1 AlpA family phage regulatory protein [Vibrio alginolyticus]HCZ9034629.1 AlpA family phage regulatory protein [Vibrio alginolyticus]